MDLNQIKQKAIQMGLPVHRKKKYDLIHDIQRAENNIECFGTPRVDYCNEGTCMWRADCVSFNQVLKRKKPAVGLNS